MKKLLSFVVLTAVFAFWESVMSAQINFGLTSVVQTNKLFLIVEGPTNLSYSVQYSTNGLNWSATPSFVTAYAGKPAFVQLIPPSYGYYRAVTSSNSVFYVSTNSPLIYGLKASLVGANRQINVLGPTNLAYVIEGSTNLMNWTPQFIGVTGQTNFIDPQILQRFYRGKTQ